MWPARGIAEHAYCPRLFYYMTVEGVFVPSSDTEKGAEVHRRVDRPSAGRTERSTIKTRAVDDAEAKFDEADADLDRPRSLRSFVLSSERLGLTATLDLAEITGTTAIPVEYRKGRCNRSWRFDEPSSETRGDEAPPPAPEPWPTDRVQVGLQVLLLEEAGYVVPEAHIYYAAEKLRLRLPVDDSLRQFARAHFEAAKLVARGPRPSPLVNDPRCPRCSLQPICLPDEINHQRFASISVDGRPLETTPDEFTPRKLWPPRDDGIHVVTQSEGLRVGVRGESVRVTDKDGRVVRDLPLTNIESLAVLGSVQVSTQALTVFADHEVPVAFMSSAGRLVAMMDPLGPTSASVRAAQVRTLDRPERALELAKAITVAKIANQRTVLMRNHVGLRQGVAAELLDCARAAEGAATMDQLRGHEGNAAAIYFANFAGLFKEGASELATRFDSNGRQRRPPPDPINSVLSFGYSMLSNECTAACRLASLEPTLGAMHAIRPGRPSLALDLMEPFRPLIADSVAISAFNRGELAQGHFLDTVAGCALTGSGRKAFFSAYGRRMDAEVRHPVFDYRLTYRRMLMLHARLVAAWFLGEVPTLTFLTTR